MSRWKANFEMLQLAQRVQSIISQIEALEGLSEPDLAEYARLLKILKLIEVRFTKLDPELFNLSTWEKCSSCLNDAHNQIQMFTQNKNISHLQNANNIFDKVVDILQPLENNLKADESKSIVEASALFHQKIIDELERVRNRGDEINSQLSSLSDLITQSKSRIDENNQIIQQQKARLDQSIADFQKQFSDAQEKRSKDFSDSMKENAESFSAKQESFDTKFQEFSLQIKDESKNALEIMRQQSDEHLKFLQKRENEVNEIFGAIGTTAFAGNFKKTADNEAKSANLLRWIALVLMFAMVVVAGLAFYYSITHDPDWKVFAFRLATVIVLGFPAYYAANESSRHRERERQNQKIHLELASLDAYLVLLPVEERNKIKGGLTDKFFGVPIISEKTEDISQKDLLGVISKIVNGLIKSK